MNLGMLSDIELAQQAKLCLLYTSQQPGPLHEAASFSAGIAGAEYNVAVGLRRLGHEAGYLTRLGRDPFGKRIAAQMEKNGLDLSLVSYSRERATGFMLKAKSSLGDPDIFLSLIHISQFI